MITHLTKSQFNWMGEEQAAGVGVRDWLGYGAIPNVGKICSL